MFSDVQMLGEQLERRLCEGLVIFEIRLRILSIKFLAHRNQIRFFDFVLLALGVVFDDTVCGSLAVGRIGEGGGCLLMEV